VLGLGPWEPFRSTEIVDIHSFTYDRKTGQIVQERVKKVPAAEGAPLSVVTQVPITGDVRENPVATTREGFAFMDATVDNIQRLCQQNEEKEMKIKELEEKLQQVRIDERSLLSFKASVGKVRNELEGAIIDMYANLHLFQNIVATVIEQNNRYRCS
jgi:hypothetical protein